MGGPGKGRQGNGKDKEKKDKKEEGGLLIIQKGDPYHHASVRPDTSGRTSTHSMR